MGFSIIFLSLFVILIGIYSLVLLELNKSVVSLDLLFVELDLQLGYILLIATLIGILVSLFLEIIFLSSKRKKKNE
jgi:uncharacterized integral membrane protein